jgi:hypothetical protein
VHPRNTAVVVNRVRVGMPAGPIEREGECERGIARLTKPNLEHAVNKLGTVRVVIADVWDVTEHQLVLHLDIPTQPDCHLVSGDAGRLRQQNQRCLPLRGLKRRRRQQRRRRAEKGGEEEEEEEEERRNHVRRKEEEKEVDVDWRKYFIVIGNAAVGGCTRSTRCEEHSQWDVSCGVRPLLAYARSIRSVEWRR